MNKRAFYVKYSKGLPLSCFRLESDNSGVPTEARSAFHAECQDFNPVQVKGAVRWLKKPTKPEGSIVFAVDTQREQQYCLQKGLFIAGKRVSVVNFKTHSQYSQCPRCQGFGHNPAQCRKRIACKLCAGKHFTKNHQCTICNSSSECSHMKAKCANCGENHPANNRDCEILKAVRGVSGSQSRTKTPSTNDQ